MGSRFFSVHLAHQVDFEIALGKQALELRVIELKRFQTLYVVWNEAGKVLVDGGLHQCGAAESLMDTSDLRVTRGERREG